MAYFRKSQVYRLIVSLCKGLYQKVIEGENMNSEI